MRIFMRQVVYSYDRVKITKNLISMSLEKAKELLWSFANNYTDEEIMQMIDYLMAIANIVIENHYKKRGY